MDFKKTDRNKVKRVPKRGHYDRATIYPILDAGLVCHVGFVVEGQPFVIPTIYGRDGDVIYLHGSTKSRMVNQLGRGIPVCLTVTHMDGLVLARSAFHHSMNYRSAVVFGKAKEVHGEEKERALFIISENMLAGRWDEVRPPSEKELKATSVLRLDIESASAKIRAEGVNDDKADYELPIWAGLVPMTVEYGAPVPDPLLPEGIALPESLTRTAGM